MSKRRQAESLESLLEKKRISDVKRKHSVKRLESRKKYASTRIKRIQTKKFVAWDGEGITVGKEHKYILLMHSEGGYAQNIDGIPTIECFNFLCDVANEYKDYIHIIFSGSYDVNMMLKDIPRPLLKKLHATGKLYWKHYNIEYRPKKFFSIARYDRDFSLHKTKRKPNGYIELWDVFGFFQGSFLNALTTFFSDEEKEALGYSQIKAGKERRSVFSEKELENFIIPYTQLEVKALVRLLERLYNEYCLQATPVIQLKRFDGAGAIAHSLMTTYKIKDYYGAIPEDMMIASQHGYGGGRIELIQYGHTKRKLYRYDINSAYPSEHVHMPDLSHGRWLHSENGNMLPFDEGRKGRIAIYKVFWNYGQNPSFPFYPFFYRSLHGDITFPSYGLNWVYEPELFTAIKWNKVLQGEIYILEKWVFIPDDETCKPYQFIQELYNRRRELKKQGNGMQQVYKLGYNSLYGKTVQHVGYEQHEKKDVHWRPPFFQLQIGGMITSGVRAKMFDAAMQNPYDIIGFATDGLWSLSPLDIPTGNNLGEWEYEELDGGTFVQAGVYWTHKEGIVTHHYRGFDKENLKEEKVIQSWSEEKLFLDVTTTRFITLGQGLILKDPSLWHTMHTSERSLKLHPTDGTGKREIIEEYKNIVPHPEKGLIRTRPNNMKVILSGENIHISEPFPLPWTKERVEYNSIREDVMVENEIIESIEEQYE